MSATIMIPVDEIERARARAEAAPLISIQEVAEQYGISLRTLRRRQAGGLMPSRTKHGRWLKYQKTEIAELIARQKNRACSKDGSSPEGRSCQ
jgi:predicted DNA-binding transcriptional regulator AlpA